MNNHASQIRSNLILFICSRELFRSAFPIIFFRCNRAVRHIEHIFITYQGTFGGGACVIDYNDDGYQDLFITGGSAQNVLYKNNGNSTFTDVTQSAGLAIESSLVSQGVTSADVNRDGFVDLFITTVGDELSVEQFSRGPNLLYLNNGDGTFTDVSSQYGFSELKTFSTGAAFGDINSMAFLIYMYQIILTSSMGI